MIKFFEKHASFSIILAMLLGLTAPYLGPVLNDYVLWFMAGLMLATFLKIEPDHVFAELKKPLFLIFIIAVYILMIPLALFFLMKFLTPELSLGFLLYASLPPAVAAPALTNLAKGNSALSLTIMVLINMIVPFSVPFLFLLLTGSSIKLDTLGMFVTLALVILGPLLVSQVFEKITPKIINNLKPKLGGLGVVLIMFIMYTVVAHQSALILQNPIMLLKYLLILYGIVFGFYLIGFFIAPWRHLKDRIALAVTKAYPNVGLGIVLAFKFFTPEIALLLVIAEIPWATTIGAFKWLNKHLK